jgi:hypothetical protein
LTLASAAGVNVMVSADVVPRVVKDQTRLVASALPARSLAPAEPPVILAV